MSQVSKALDPSLAGKALLRHPHVQLITGRGRASLQAASKEGWFIKPLKLGRMALYPADEVLRITGAIRAGASKEDLFALVKSIHEERRREVSA